MLAIKVPQDYKFKDRFHAGERLAEELDMYKKVNPIVVALPKGGVPVGVKISERLAADLDIVVSRKITFPNSPELGVGAISEQGAFVFEEALLKRMDISNEQFHALLRKKAQEVNSMVSLYRGGKSLKNLEGQVVILVDDGLATGVTARAALLAITEQMPRKVIFASPVCSQEAAYLIRTQVDDFVCLNICNDFKAVSTFYENFEQLTDNRVVRLLNAQDKEMNFAI